MWIKEKIQEISLIMRNFFQFGRSVLIMACGDGSTSISKMLIDFGADVNAVDQVDT
jgi:hypothetical protein